MIHLCLVSAQPIPNLAPALDPALKPERVILAVSPQMEAQAAAQEAVLRRFQFPVERLVLADAWDLPALLDAFCQFLDARPGQELALNATGGTKPMAIAAQEAFRMAGRPVFYVHEQRDEVIWLDAARPAIPLVPRLKLEPFLQAHGFTVQSRGIAAIPDAWRQLAADLAGNAGTGDAAVTALNAIAKAAEDNGNRTPLRAEAKGAFDRLLAQFYRAGVVSYYDDKEVRFPTAAARQFANGGWLEAYVHTCLAKSSGRLQDYAVNLTVTAANGSKNELDAAVLHRNRLTVIEAKTRRYDERSAQDAANALYKLDSLTPLGGLRTAGILVSCLPLPNFVRQRAQDLNLTTWQGADLRRLPELLNAQLA